MKKEEKAIGIEQCNRCDVKRKHMRYFRSIDGKKVILSSVCVACRGR